MAGIADHRKAAAGAEDFHGRAERGQGFLRAGDDGLVAAGEVAEIEDDRGGCTAIGDFLEVCMAAEVEACAVGHARFLKSFPRR